MLKITAIVSLMLIATSQVESSRLIKEATSSDDSPQGNTLWAASLSCESCGSECTSACGTRHFRSCCFNYLRRKRGPEAVELYTAPHDTQLENQPKTKLPMFVVETIPVPDQWYSNVMSRDFKSYPVEDMLENHMYEA